MTLCVESYQKLFLRGYPVKLLIPVVIENSKELQDYGNQRKILDNTVLQKIVQMYPLKPEYMLAFVKQMLLEFENRCIEVCDEWYEVYCDLLNRPISKRDSHFKHFTIDDHVEKYVTIEESSSYISQGTTGLCTWKASQTLVNWCSNNKDDIKGKCVLELGAGVGLAGLTICLKYMPKAYWFTDCHPSVLGMLLSNVKINVDRERHLVEDNNSSNKMLFGRLPEVDQNILYGGTLRDTSVYVMNLPWEDVPSSNIKPIICPDIVLAADVIYDSASFLPLGNALYYLVSEKCVAVLACTIRNEETINQFLDLLGKHQLIVEEILTEETDNMLDLRDVPVRIYKVKKDSLS